MITGTVNADFEPLISLSIRRADGEVFTQEAIVDTGFNGWLSLPPDAIAEAKQHQDEEAYYEILMLAEMLQGQLLNYESALIKLEMERPYSPSIQERLIQDDFGSS